MAKHLKLDLSRIQNSNGEIDESFVAVRKRDELLAFPPNHPRPDHAITRADNVFSALDRH
jgi:hypothetical protein